MKSLALLAALLLTATASLVAADKDTRVFEMRTYHAAEGKLDALHARFRDHTMALFEKHGITNIGYWVPIENTDNVLIYVLAYPSREARDVSWKAFMSDPDWKQAQSASEVSGKLVTKVDQLFMSATDFSPEIKPSKPGEDRVFERRIYTTTPNNLPLLHARFRDHTMSLFAKHGITNLFYWQLLPGQPAAADTLVYMIAHASADAATKSWADFRADSDWIAAKAASEQKGGGSLTLPDGVKSLFLKPTDYSPTR